VAIAPFLFSLIVCFERFKNKGRITRICSSENLFTRRGYLPFLEHYAMDIAMVDVPWNGFTEAKKIADMCEPYEINVVPHNYYSPLSSFISANLCACVPNVRIMENGDRYR
jgi:galactonate dehydratase